MIICYTVPEIWHIIDVIFIFHFGLCFALLPLQQPKKSKFKKMIKKAWIYHHFTLLHQNYDQIIYGSWDMVHDVWIERWVDGKNDI